MSDTVGYRHIVLFRIHDDVPDTTVVRAIDALRNLADLPDILEWTVTLSDDPRKGRIVVENALFRHRDSIDAFRTHPRHQETSDLMRTIADWWVGDYPEPSGTVAAPDLTK